MAKLFLATEREVGLVMDKVYHTSDIQTDWYHQRFIAKAADRLAEVIHVEFPMMLFRDRYGRPIIPGTIASLSNHDIIESILGCLGVNTNAGYEFSALSGKYCDAYSDGPTRFILSNRKHSRDIILSANWHNDTPPPSNFAKKEICESRVIEFALVEDAEHDYHSATWIIRVNSPLGKLLADEAQQIYKKRIRSGAEQFRNYEKTFTKVRDDLWAKLLTIEHEKARSVYRRLECHRYYARVEEDILGDIKEEYYFYTESGSNLILGIVNDWVATDSAFTLSREF